MTTIKNKRRTVLPKRPLSCVLTSFVVAGFSSAALGNPQNHTVVEGNAPVVTSNGSELSIATDGRTILNWDSFSIANGELTRFVMSGNDRAVLNRVTGGALSQIDGTLAANGRLYLINPNGVIVGANGVVQTQSFIASTRDLTDEDFMDGGELSFFGTGSSEVHNLGTIEAADGDVALIGNRVVSSGSITAPQGVIALAAGDDVMLAVPGSERLLVRVNRVSENSTPLVDHTGILNAAQAELQAAGGNPFALAVNAGGQINATGVQNRQGRLYLSTDVAQINVAGTLTARNSDDTGGRIDIDSGVGYGSEVNVGGTLDVASTSTGGSIHIESSRVTLDDGAHLLVSGGSGNAGGVFIGAVHGTDYLLVAEGASIEGNSVAGDAGYVDLSGAGVYFHGQLHARGAGSGGMLNVRAGEAIEYTGLADLRAYDNETQFGIVSIDSPYTNLSIAPTGSDHPGIIDAATLGAQLNYGNVQITAWGTDRTVDVFAPISWQSAARLALQADGNVSVNQTIDASNGTLRLISLNGDVTVVEPAATTVRDLWLSAAGDVNLANRVVAQNVTLYDVGVRSLLTNEQNQLGIVTFARGVRAQSGEVDIVDSIGGLSLNTENSVGITYSTDGNFRVRTSGDLTLASAFQSQVDGDVTLVAAGGVLRNQSTAGASVFGTSATGLDRTRVYAAGVGDNGGLAGPAQYNVSYSVNHEATATTGFYYSRNAPQEPNPPDPVDPVDPTPETPALPPSQIVQTALGGNSFEQLNRPPQNDPSQLTPIKVPVPPMPVDQSGWTTGTTNQLETLAELANFSSGEQSQQPAPQVVDELEDVAAQMMSLLQAAGTGSSAADLQQLMQGVSSMSPELQQLFIQSPAQFQQQLAIVLTQLSMERRKALSEGRAQEMNQQIDQIKQAAEQMRNAAIEQMMNAIVAGITQIAQVAANDPDAAKIKGPTRGVTPTPLPTAPPAPEPIKNVQQPSPVSGFKFQPPPSQLPPTPPPIVVPVAPPIPPSVQAHLFPSGKSQGTVTLPPPQTSSPPVMPAPVPIVRPGPTGPK